MNLEEILTSYTDQPKVVETFLKIKKRFEKSGLNVENISLALLSIMMEVDKIRKLRPMERKQLTVAILEHFVEDLCPGDDTPLEAVLKQMIPNLIDQIQEIKRPLKCWCV